MPEDLQSASTGANDLYFADDLQGTVFKLRESAVYGADEVTDPGEVPEFGRWLKAAVDGRDVWLVAVGELIAELKRFDKPTGTLLEVTRCEKSGTSATAPYEVNLEAVDPAQDRL